MWVRINGNHGNAAAWPLEESSLVVEWGTMYNVIYFAKYMYSTSSFLSGFWYVHDNIYINVFIGGVAIHVL